jgi:glutamate synthase (NADPH/NADH) large chain
MCFLPQDEPRELRDGFFEKFIAKEGTDRLARRARHARRPGQDRDRIDAGDPPVSSSAARTAPIRTFERKLLAIRKQTQNPLAAMAEKHGCRA